MVNALDEPRYRFGFVIGGNDNAEFHNFAINYDQPFLSL